MKRHYDYEASSGQQRRPDHQEELKSRLLAQEVVKVYLQVQHDKPWWEVFGVETLVVLVSVVVMVVMVVLHSVRVVSAMVEHSSVVLFASIGEVVHLWVYCFYSLHHLVSAACASAACAPVLRNLNLKEIFA